MPGKTKIEWTDYTSNGITARRKGISYAHLKSGWFCDKPDAKGGCLFCYAESINLRWGNGLRFDKANRDQIEFTIRNNEQRDLLKLNEKHPGSKVFIGDMFDLFQPSIPVDMLRQLFNTYEDCTNLTLQFLTKYTARMAHFLTERYKHDTRLPNHFWLGMSAANRSWFDKNISHLLSVNANRFISFEPLLEDLKLDQFDLMGIDWAVIGGESGGSARPCDVAWIEKLIEQCKLAGAACFVKQLGSNPQAFSSYGRVLNQVVLKSYKGGDMNEWPENLRIREFPQ